MSLFSCSSERVAVFWTSCSGPLGFPSLVLGIMKINHFFFPNSCSTQCCPSVCCNLLILALCEGGFKKGESALIQNRQLLPLAGWSLACCCGISALLPHFCDWPGRSCDPVAVEGMRYVRWRVLVLAFVYNWPMVNVPNKVQQSWNSTKKINKWMN